MAKKRLDGTSKKIAKMIAAGGIPDGPTELTVVHEGRCGVFRIRGSQRCDCDPTITVKESSKK